MDVYVKIRKQGKNVLLSICDENLIGRTLTEGKIVFKITNEFYYGKKISVEQAISMIENSTIVNLVGNICVEKAIKKGFVHPAAILKIQGISHAQIVKV